MFGLFLMRDVGFVSCGTWGLSHVGCGVCLMWDVGFVSCEMWGLWNDCNKLNCCMFSLLQTQEFF